MKRDYIKYFVGLAACSFLGLTSCDDDKDLGGKMDEMITVSTITLNETQYDAGNKTICLLKNKELQLSWSIAPENATDANVQWTSSDESIVAVTREGKVVTKDKAGKAIITLTRKSVSVRRLRSSLEQLKLWTNIPICQPSI